MSQGSTPLATFKSAAEFNGSFSEEGSVPNNSLCLSGTAVPNNSLALPQAAAAGLVDQLIQVALYNNFANPPSTSPDTTRTEGLFRDLEPKGSPPSVAWGRIVALLKPEEAAAHGSMYPAAATLDIQKFMDFIDVVARSFKKTSVSS